MARCPEARWLPIPENSRQAHISPTQLILHSVAAPWNEDRVREYFAQSNVVVESHFAVDYDGSAGQFIDTNVRADANMSSNNKAISIESAANTHNTDPWTEAQINKIVKIMVWAHRVHGIPARICRSANDPGYGIHRMFSSWSGGGTYCPGDARAHQFTSTVFPRFLAAINGKPPTPEPAPKGTWIWDSVGPGQTNNSVKIVQQSLIKLGYRIPAGPTGYWGTQTKAAYAAWQRHLGFHGADADGSPGPTSLNALARAAGFSIRH